MKAQTLAAVQSLRCQAASLLLYQSVLAGEVGGAFLRLLLLLQDCEQGHEDGILPLLQAYGDWFKALAVQNQSWQRYLLTRMLQDDNPFTQRIQGTELADLPPALVAAVERDLRGLQQLYACSSARLSQWVQQAANLPDAPTVWADPPAGVDKAANQEPVAGQFGAIVENQQILSFNALLQ